jgi:soluble lytic murein transglycosylase-like protein
MDEDVFIRSIFLKKSAFVLCIVVASTFLAFSSSGVTNLRPQPQYEQVEKEPAVDIYMPPALGKKSKRYHDIILKAATRYMVDPELIKAIVMAESGYDPQAVSSQGATGLMQLMPRTAESLGVEDAFNPEHNVNAGVRYFKQLLEEFNCDIELALAAYNAGSSTVKRHHGIPPIKATQHYVKKVFAYYHYYKNEIIGQADSV